jgi:hypothetical protein
MHQLLRVHQEAEDKVVFILEKPNHSYGNRQDKELSLAEQGSARSLLGLGIVVSCVNSDKPDSKFHQKQPNRIPTSVGNQFGGGLSLLLSLCLGL